MYVHVCFHTKRDYRAIFDPDICSPHDEHPIILSGGSLSLHLSLQEARELANQLENAAAQVSVARARNLPRDEDD